MQKPAFIVCTSMHTLSRAACQCPTLTLRSDAHHRNGHCIGSIVYAAMHINTSAKSTQESQALRAIAEPNRLRILQALRDGESCCGKQGRGLCECGIRERLSISQPTVSHHLAVLRKAGLIGTERRGQWIWYYRIEDKIQRLVRFVRDEV